MQPHVPILVYHKVDTRFEWGITRVKPAQFRRQMIWLAEHDYHTITLRQWLTQDYNPDQKNIILTFDDAYLSVFENAFPILREFGFQATVFVITDFVGQLNLWDVNLGFLKFRHMDWQQLQTLVQAGWEIGSHTRNHVFLPGCDVTEQRRQLMESREIIEQQLNCSCTTIGYPFGRVSPETLIAAQEAGYLAGCVLNSKCPADPLQLERCGVYWWDTLHDFRAKLTPGRSAKYQRRRQAFISFCARGTVLVKRIPWKKMLASE